MVVQTVTQQKVALTGNEAVAMAMKQINPDVVAAYPITPQTDIVQYFSTFVADGKVKTEFVTVESEHSAMSACVGSCAAGARTMTATSSQGLALMWEMLYIAAGFRLPIVMPVVNRALSTPINIHCDHSDSMGARDSGWIQLYGENAQEAYDNTIQAMRIAEHPDVRLPVMVCHDGFVISHSLMNLEVLPDEAVTTFVGEFTPRYPLLDVEHPVTYGALALQDSYFEARRQIADGMSHAPAVILEVGKEYGRLSGREYGFFEAHRLEDAEVAVVAIGSAAGSAKAVADSLRARGIKAGVLKVRVFRPWPWREIGDALASAQVVGVMDRADGLSNLGGPLFGDIRSALYDRARRPLMVDYIYGLGGRDVSLEDIEQVFRDLLRIKDEGRAAQLVTYLGVRE